MKRTSFCVIAALMAVLLVSCEFEDNSQYTPQMVLSTPTRICVHADSVGVKDTLGYRYDEDGRGVLDTIHVGDTVRFVIALNAQGNSLTGFQTTWDTASLSLEYLAMDSIVYALDTANCNINAGILRFLPGYNMAVFPIRYVPRKAVTADIVFEVQSDSKYSPNTFTIRQTARDY